jgi:hypothetical protein
LQKRSMIKGLSYDVSRHTRGRKFTITDTSLFAPEKEQEVSRPIPKFDPTGAANRNPRGQTAHVFLLSKNIPGLQLFSAITPTSTTILSGTKIYALPRSLKRQGNTSLVSFGYMFRRNLLYACLVICCTFFLIFSSASAYPRWCLQQR